MSQRRARSASSGLVITTHTVTLLDYHVSYTTVKVSCAQLEMIRERVSPEITGESILPFGCKHDSNQCLCVCVCF